MGMKARPNTTRPTPATTRPTRAALRKVLAAVHGNVSEAARRLSVSRVSVHRWINEYQLDTNPLRTNKPETAPVRRPPASTLRRLLKQHRNNVATVAATLGVGRNTLYRWLRVHGVDIEARRKKLESGRLLVVGIPSDTTLREARQAFEKAYVSNALASHDGDRQATIAQLDISNSSFKEKIRDES